jgi:hypothetical protein
MSDQSSAVDSAISTINAASVGGNGQAGTEEQTLAQDQTGVPSGTTPREMERLVSNCPEDYLAFACATASRM